MSAEHSTIFQTIGLPHHYNHVAGASLVAVGLVGVGLYVRAKLKDPDHYLVPDGKVSIVNISVYIVQLWKNLLDNMIGHGADKFIPFIGTYFLFILLNNLTGMIPGFLPATDNINTNMAMAVVSFFTYQYYGIKEHGFHYLSQFTGGLPPKGYGFLLTTFLTLLAGLLFVIELMGHLIRPLSLSLRLWGNINGDHTLVNVFMELVPFLLPIVAMALGVFVCFIQSLVFSLLSAVYIKLAVSHDH